MKKVIGILSLIITLGSCSSSPSIPENSIYQEGDVVYKIDRLEGSFDSENKSFACDVEFIYRADRKELIFVEFGKPKWYDFITRIEYGMIHNNELECDVYHSQDEGTSYLIADNYVVIVRRGEDIKYHILQTVKY